MPQNLADSEVVGAESTEVRCQPTTKCVIPEPLDFRLLQRRRDDITEDVCRGKRVFIAASRRLSGWSFFRVNPAGNIQQPSVTCASDHIVAPLILSLALYGTLTMTMPEQLPTVPA